MSTKTFEPGKGSNVGPWRPVQHYVDSKGDLIRVEKRWKGTPSGRSTKVTHDGYTYHFSHCWDTSNEVREVVLDSGFEPYEKLGPAFWDLYD